MTDAAAASPDPGRGVWRRVRRNAAMVLGGRAAFGLLNLASAAIAVRVAGLEAFGVVVILQAYARLCAGLIRFHTWPAVAKFGADALGAGDTEAFRRLIGFTVRLDLAGLAAAIGVGLAIAPAAASQLGWPPEALGVAPLFVATIPFITAASPTGVLRLFDRIAPLVRQHGANALLRFGGVLAVAAFGGGLTALAAVWAGASILSGAMLMVAAGSELRRRGLAPRMLGGWSTLAHGFPGLWRFVTVLKGTAVLDTAVTYGAVLAVGALLGPAGAGLFGLARQFTEPLSKLTALLGPIVFPEFAWAEARGDRAAAGRLLRRTMAVVAAALAALGGALWLGGEAALVALFGPEAAAAEGLLIAAGAAAGLSALGFAVEPLLLTLRADRAVLVSALIAALVFAVALWALTGWLGLLGAGLALLARQIALFAWRLAALRRALERRS